MIRTALGLVGTIGLASIAQSALAAAPGLEDGHYTIDPSHTYAHFEINHMGLSTLRGRVDVKSGTIVIDRKNQGSRVDVTLDPASVDTGNAARDAHLRNMDGFFDVKKYPDIRFRSTAVHFDSDDPDEATVEGKLTLHGVTRSVTLDVDDIACRVNPMEKKNYTCGFEAETKIHRSDFGMTKFSQLVGDEVELSIEVEANKPVEGGS